MVELLNITIASDELNLKNLKKLTKDFISIIKKEFGTLQIIFHHQSLVDLQEFCLEAICPEPKISFNSNKFIHGNYPLNYWNFSNVKAWILMNWDLRILIKWGLAQEHNFSKDVSLWSQDYIMAFKRIICRFIPLIRFYDISPKVKIMKFSLHFLDLVDYLNEI